MTRKLQQKDTFSIAQAAEYLELSEQRIRKALKAGTLAGHKETIEGTNYTVWKITRNALDAYREEFGARGRTKQWVVALTPEQLNELLPTLKAMNIDLKPRFTYDAEKSRAYREARKEREGDEDGEE